VSIGTVTRKVRVAKGKTKTVTTTGVLLAAADGTLNDATNWTNSVAFSWDGADQVADSGADGSATIWTLPTPVLLTGNKAASVAYSPNGSAIAVGGTN